MDGKEIAQKYGVWIVAGALVLYLVYRQKGGSALRPSLPGGGGGGGSNNALEAERLRQAGALDLEKLKLNSDFELQRLRLQNDRFNLEQQALARKRALDIAGRGQTTGLINQLLKNLESLMRGGSSKTGSTGGGEGRSLPQTPNTFPGRPSLPPAYPIPVPNISDNDLYNPPFTPAYPEITDYPLSVTDWGEAPQFESAGMGLDSGATFYDQWGGGDFNYGYGYDSYYSSYPDLTSYGDTGSYLGSGGDDFYYGYGAGEYYGGEGEVSGGSAGDIGAGDDFVYGYGEG